MVLAISGPLFAALVDQDATAAFLACFGVAAALAIAALLVAARIKPTP